MDAAAAAHYKEGYAVAPITLKTQGKRSLQRTFLSCPTPSSAKLSPKRQATRGYSPPHAENRRAGRRAEPASGAVEAKAEAWLPFGGDASEAQDGVPGRARRRNGTLVALGRRRRPVRLRRARAAAAGPPRRRRRATLTCGYGAGAGV